MLPLPLTRRVVLIVMSVVARELTGLSKGGAQIDKSRVQFLTALEQIVELASLQVREESICDCQAVCPDAVAPVCRRPS